MNKSYTSTPEARPWNTARETAVLNSWTKAAQGRKPIVRHGWFARLMAFLFGA